MHAGGPPGVLAGFAGALGGDEAAELGFVGVGVEAGGVVGVVAVAVVVADLGGAPGVPVAAVQAPDRAAFAGEAGWPHPDGAWDAQPPVQGGASAGNPGGAGVGTGVSCGRWGDPRSWLPGVIGWGTRRKGLCHNVFFIDI